MIDAKELRIGNYFMYDKKLVFIAAILKDNRGGDGFEKSLPLQSLRPIPLIEEWLLKFGFEIVEDLGDMKYYERPKIKKYGVEFNHENLCFYENTIINGYITLIYDEPYFQHILQNLIYSLTGKELEMRIQYFDTKEERDNYLKESK